MACCITSKNGGTGPCERDWEDVKYIADGERFNLGKSLKNRAIIFATECLKEARTENEVAKPIQKTNK